MKKAVVLFFILITLGSYAQEKLSYNGKVQVDSNLKKNDLFNNARTWFNNSFNNSKNVIQIIDKETGEISAKGSIKYTSNVVLSSAVTSGYINFSVSIFVKDGKYKYEFTNFTHEGTPGVKYNNSGISFGLITTHIECPKDIPGSWQGWRNKVWDDIKSQINDNIIPLISSLKQTMITKANSNW